VPKVMVSKAVGEGGKNVKEISKIIKKKVKVIPIPKGIEDVEKFIEKIVSPVEFKEAVVEGDEIILTAGSMSKAALIGRNRRRLIEMQKIMSSFFGKEFRIV
jgi:transcription antitermination factor NusA-like protein